MTPHRRYRFLQRVNPLALVALVLTAAPLSAQADFVKKSEVILRFPLCHLTRFQHPSQRWVRLEGKLARSGSDITVNGDPHWRSAGFPPWTVYKIDQVRKEDTLTTVRLTAKRQPPIELILYGDPTLYRDVLARPDQAEQVRAEAYDRIAQRLFIGEVAAMPAESRHRLLAFADSARVLPEVTVSTFEGVAYLGIYLGTDSMGYNSRRLDAAARASEVIGTWMLDRVRRFAPLGEATGIGGVKLTIEVPYQDFGRRSKIDRNRLQIYVRSSIAARFAGGEITGQQMIDSSVVVIDGTATRVVLSQP
jgi:hypothetical protein